LSLQKYVSEILEDIKINGLSAVKKYSQKFDDYQGEITLSKEEWNIESDIPQSDKETIKQIIKRLQDYHSKQKTEDIMYENEYGSIYGLIKVPIDRIGIYVPGGKPLPSSLLMVAVPAQIAGVKGYNNNIIT